MLWSILYCPLSDIFSVEADPRALVVQCPNKPSNASTNCNPFKAPCLYNITHDPCEYFNIADENPGISFILFALISMESIANIYVTFSYRAFVIDISRPV